MTRTLSTRSSDDSYLELVLAFPLRPIRSRGAHQHAKAVLRGLSGKRGAAARDYKGVLASLVADYERSANLRMNTSNITAAQIVRHLLGERDMTINALARVLNISQGSLSDMLNGRRQWSKHAIIRICDYFGLQPGLFLRQQQRAS